MSKTHVADDGTVRQSHYGAGRQPWDDIVAAGWGPGFAVGNVLKYLRRDKEVEHSLESARWYWDQILFHANDHSTASFLWIDAKMAILRMLTEEERTRLIG